VAEGADVPPLPHTAADASSSPRCHADVCVAAVLGDAQHRVSVLGGREGMARSLGSVYGGSVTRFLGGGFRGVVSHVTPSLGMRATCSGVAVSRDGSKLLFARGKDLATDIISAVSIADGSVIRDSEGRIGELLCNGLRQLWVAADGFVFAASSRWNHFVEVYSPELTFQHALPLYLRIPTGVCANAHVIVVSVSGRVWHDGSREGTDGIVVFRRHDFTFVSTFSSTGPGDGQLNAPCGLCFTCSERHVAVADSGNNRVSVFRTDGAFVRHVGDDVLRSPQSVASSVYDELVVADTGNRCVRVFNDMGHLAMTFGDANVTGVALYRSTVFVAAKDAESIPAYT
jgi:hypothetical protein